MGYNVSLQFAQLVVVRYDTQARRYLTLDNFIQSCVLLKSITDQFRLKDTQRTGSITISYEECLSMVLLNKPWAAHVQSVAFSIYCTVSTTRWALYRLSGGANNSFLGVLGAEFT